MLRIEALAADVPGAAAAAGRRPADGPRADRGGQRHRPARGARGAARGGLEPHRHRRRDRLLRLPPRAAARGRPRRPAARRARRAAPRDRARARGADAARGRRRRAPHRRDRPPLHGRRRPAGRVRRVRSRRRVVDGRAGLRRGGRPAGPRDRALQPRPGRRGAGRLRPRRAHGSGARWPATTRATCPRSTALLEKAIELVDEEAEPRRVRGPLRLAGALAHALGRTPTRARRRSRTR